MEPSQHQSAVLDLAPRASQPGWLWVSTEGKGGPSVVPARIEELLASGLRTPRKESMRSWAAGLPPGRHRSASPLRPAKTPAPATKTSPADAGKGSPPLESACRVPEPASRAPTAGLLASVYQQPDTVRRALPRGWLASVYLDSQDAAPADEVLKDPVKAAPNGNMASPEPKPLLGCGHFSAATVRQNLITTSDQRDVQRRSVRLWESRDVEQEMDELTKSLGGCPTHEAPADEPPVDPLLEALGAMPVTSDDRARKYESKPLRPPRTSAHYLITPDDAEAKRLGQARTARQGAASPVHATVQRRGVRDGGDHRDVQREMSALALDLADVDEQLPSDEPPAEPPAATQAVESESKRTQQRHDSSHYLITPGDQEDAWRRGISHSGELRDLQQEIEDLTMSLEELQQDLRKKSGLPHDCKPEATLGGE